MRFSFTRLASAASICVTIVFASAGAANAQSVMKQCGDQWKAAKAADTVVWVNSLSHVYHLPGLSSHGRSYYGHTKEGAYMCEADAKAAGNRAAKDERHP